MPASDAKAGYAKPAPSLSEQEVQRAAVRG